MILFIAPNPWNVESRNGYLQRVAAIDRLYQGEEKFYYDDLKNNSEKLMDVIDRSSMIYVHSIYQAEKILPFYYTHGDKIVTDLHGSVPEEEEMAGHIDKAVRMGDVEKLVFKHGKHFVCVTDRMRQHLANKYPYNKAESWINLPIFEITTAPQPVKHERYDPGTAVIYAGGTGIWQNVDLMIDTVKKTAKLYKYTILSPHTERFSAINDVATIKTVDSKDVAQYYEKSAMGFILRDESVVNDVACPTKLIEYLRDGVVPIVLTSDIGDFKDLGYQYISLDKFVESRPTPDTLYQIAKNNKIVYDKLLDKHSQGIDALTMLFKKLKLTTREADSGKRLEIKAHVEMAMDRYKLVDENTELSRKTREDRDSLKRLEEMVDQRDRTLNDIYQSRSWRLTRLLGRILR